MREEYSIPEMEVIQFGTNNVVTSSVSNFVDPVLPGDDGEYEEDEW